MQPLPKLSSLTLPWPTDWDALFGASRPLIVEIGFGRGTYLLHLARTHPDHHVIGLEVSNRCLTAAETAAAREGLPNIRTIHTMAETALHHLFEPEQISQIHINFPDPWFKRDQGHRRLVQRDTLDAMVSRLVPGGLLYLATDILAYAEMTAALLAATPGLDNLLPTPWANAMPGRVVTKYEAKAQVEGRTCYYFACQRNDQPAPPVPVRKELPMPHVVLQSPLTLETIQARFAPMERHDGTLHVRSSSAYRAERAILFEIHLGEPTIEQHTALLLTARRTPGEYTLQTTTLGHPRVTPGMHLAVTMLAEWLLSLDANNRVIEQKLAE